MANEPEVTQVLRSKNSYDEWVKGVEFGAGFWAIFLPERAVFELHHGQCCVAVTEEIDFGPGDMTELVWPIIAKPGSTEPCAVSVTYD